jgi:hypothetical protein
VINAINWGERSRMSDITIKKFKSRIVQELSDVFSLAAPEIVETHYAVAIG